MTFIKIRLRDGVVGGLWRSGGVGWGTKGSIRECLVDGVVLYVDCGGYTC